MELLKQIIIQRLKEANITDQKIIKIIQEANTTKKINLNKITTEEELINQISTISLLNDAEQIKQSTIQQYLNKIKIIHKKIFNFDLNINDLNFLKNTKLLINKIYCVYNSSNSTLLGHFIALTAICRRIGFTIEADEYNKEMIKQRDIIHKQQGNNELTAKELKNYTDWLTILNHIPPQEIHSRAIYTLYTSLPPRRLDYKDMIVKYGNHNINDLSDEYNYYLPDQNLLVFKNYKTYKTYKTQIINLLDENTTYANYKKVKAILEEVIKTKKDNDFLFTTKQNKPIKNFSNTIKKAFSINDKYLTVNLLRHSFLSWFTSKTRTSNILEKVSYMMAHSVSTQSRYRKIDRKIIFD